MQGLSQRVFQHLRFFPAPCVVCLVDVVLCGCVYVCDAACTMGLNQIGGWQGGWGRHVLQRHGDGGSVTFNPCPSNVSIVPPLHIIIKLSDAR